MQAFYWNCPEDSGKEFGWWNYLRNEIPHLKATGITSLWLPPACKANEVKSMGYDPFDFYDLGEYKQKNHDRKETWFGSKEDLQALIQAAHDSSHHQPALRDRQTGSLCLGERAIDGQGRRPGRSNGRSVQSLPDFIFNSQDDHHGRRD